MAITAEAEPESDQVGAPDGSHDALATRQTSSQSFFWWAGGIFLLALAALMSYSLRATDGRFAYVLDDGAIHISVGRTLAHHFTWGVQAGHFESASSSPVWTVLVAITTLFPGGTVFGPLVLNIGAGLLALWVLGNAQKIVAPGPRRKLDIVAVAVLSVVLLFLPSLAMTGMEHVLHMAIAMAVVWMFHRRSLGEGPTRTWLPYALLGLAVLIRFESLFLAVGLGVALLAGAWRPLAVTGPARWLDRFRDAVVVGVVAAVPFAAFAAFNVAMGGEVLPNSVVAKTILGQGLGGQKGLRGYAERLTTDTLLIALVVLALGYLALAASGLVGERRRRAIFPAVAFVVTVALHVGFAQVGWFERYQAYLIGLGLFTALSIAAATVPVEARSFAPAVLCFAVLLAPVKWQLAIDTPTASDNTYRQRYQAGKFLGRFYKDQPVATGELGYISLFHEGSVTDLFGLGDTEVLKTREHNRETKQYWADLARRRKFRVAAVYSSTLLFDTPDPWILVATWHLNEKRITAYESDFQFWATTPDEVDPLKAHLKAFERSLPRAVTTTYNQFAELRRDRVRAALRAGKPGG